VAKREMYGYKIGDEDYELIKELVKKQWGIK